MAGQGACSPWHISHLEGAGPEDLVPVQRGCMKWTKGGASCEQSARVCITRSRGGAVGETTEGCL